MINRRIGLVIFTVLFIVTISYTANQLNVSGISCSDPGQEISQPSNSTNLQNVVGTAEGVVNVFFGCSSSNPLISGLFIALQAGMIIVLLFIVKDLVPLT